MKLLVTGGAGFIGSNFIRFWLKSHPSDSVVNFDALTYAGRLENLKDVAELFGDRYDFVQGSIADPKAVGDMWKAYTPDVVVNFAAESHNSRAILSPQIFFETNVMGTQTLLDAARTLGVNRFHHISTCEVYGDLALDSQEKFTETSPYHPRTPYNASKAATDLVVRAYGDTFKVPFTISNCANNYGPYQFPEKIIPRFVALALSGQNLTLYKSSKNRREWIHVDDHCRAVEAILIKGKEGETYNVGTGVEKDIEAIADIIVKELKTEASRKTYVEDRPGHDRRYVLDSSKITRELGWKPQVAFEDGIRDTIAWYKHNEWWWRPLFETASLEVAEQQWTGKKP